MTITTASAVVPGVRPVHSARALLGEGPVWVAAQRALFWLDIKGRRILAWWPDEARGEEWRCGFRLSALAPCRDGGFIAGSERGFVRLEIPPGEIRMIGHPEPHLPGNRANDGKVDPWGHFWLGTMDDAEVQDCGALYRLDPDLSWHRMAEGYRVPNGPTFSPDGRWLYHTDSVGRAIYRFALSPDGSLGQREPFARFDEAHGYPDGMTTDAEGCLWVAFWDGWCLRRLSPAGEVLAQLDLPVQRPTSCAFGGEGLDQLFVTSARVGLSAEALAAQPEAGSLFSCDAGTTGLPAPLFPA